MTASLAERALVRLNEIDHGMADLAVLEVLEKHEATPSGHAMDRIIEKMNIIKRNRHEISTTS